MEEKKIRNNNLKIIILFVLLGILIFSYGIINIKNYIKVSSNDYKINNNIYIDELECSNYTYDEIKDKVNIYKDSFLNQTIKLKLNDKEIEVSYKDLGLGINTDLIINEIKDYEKGLNYFDKKKLEDGNTIKKFNIIYDIDKDTCIKFLNNLKSNNDIGSLDGYFDTSNGVRYVSGHNGYSLKVEESYSNIEKIVSDGINKHKSIELSYDIVNASYNKEYESIDSLVSTFSTNFNQWEGTRPTNLRTALGYINGAVVNPGEVFSFYKYAGPFNKKGYVFYYEFVGNGVCQIATTTYNAALLGGLEIVKRYPHAKKSKYVDGGLDATVASYSSGWYVDMQWKNTYKYPIYIKAYSYGGTATVELWSNSNAKEGKTYSTESVKIGVRGYQSYLHTYQNGSEISRDLIATTWYTEE